MQDEVKCREVVPPPRDDASKSATSEKAASCGAPSQSIMLKVLGKSSSSGSSKLIRR